MDCDPRGPVLWSVNRESITSTMEIAIASPIRQGLADAELGDRRCPWLGNRHSSSYVIVERGI